MSWAVAQLTARETSRIATLRAVPRYLTDTTDGRSKRMNTTSTNRHAPIRGCLAGALSIVAVTAVLAPAPVFAQSRADSAQAASDQGTILQEVIVTAEKRE